MLKSLTCDFSFLWVCLCVYACCAAWKVRFFIHHTSVCVCVCVCMMMMMMMMMSTQITSRLFISGCESRLKMFIWLSSWFGECCLCFHSSLNKHVLTAVMALNLLHLLHTFSVTTTAKYVTLNKFKVISLKEHVRFCCRFYRYIALCRQWSDFLSTSHKVVIGSVPLRIITYLIIMKSNLHKDMEHNYIQMLINLHRMKPNPKVSINGLNYLNSVHFTHYEVLLSVCH